MAWHCATEEYEQADTNKFEIGALRSNRRAFPVTAVTEKIVSFYWFDQKGHPRVTCRNSWRTRKRPLNTAHVERNRLLEMG